jgi:tetratricopeptide (TPR) repeat protein
MGIKDETVVCPACEAENRDDSYYCHLCGAFLKVQEGTRSYTPAVFAQLDTIKYTAGQDFAGRYRIIEEIGRGGMGRVYKAEDTELGITVALKMIRPEYSRKPDFIKRFKKEMLLARSLSHENIIRIHDMGEVDKIKYISMEYIKGQNLRDLIHTSGALSIDSSTKIFRQICAALKFAHGRDIIHRDLKPSNIMVDTEGRVHAMDFGLAKSLEDHESRAKGAIVGTPQYLSPEQARGEKAEKTSDIYALGLILFEMLAGKNLFEADSIAGYIHKHIYEAPPQLARFNPKVPPYLENIVYKCLEKRSERRYQSIDALLADLDKQDPKYKSILKRRRNRKWFYAAGLATFSIVGILALYSIFVSKTPGIPQPKVAVMLFENLTGDQNNDIWGRMIQELLNTDLGQSRFIRVLPDDELFQILKYQDALDTTQFPSELLEAIASDKNVTHFILGSYGKAAATSDIWITVELRQVGLSEVMDSGIVQGESVDSIPSMVDDLTRTIKTKLDINQLDLAADYDQEIGNITSNSRDAQIAYILGKRSYYEGNHYEAIKNLENAIDRDPDFAMAHYLLSRTYSILDVPEKSSEHLSNALDIINQAPDQMLIREHYIIRGYAAQEIDHSPRKALGIYLQLHETYPDDEEAVQLIGIQYRLMEEWNLAKETYSQNLDSEDRSIRMLAAENVAFSLAALGQYDEAISILEKYQDSWPNLNRNYRLKCLFLLCQGKFKEALKAMDSAISAQPNLFQNIEYKGNVFQAKGNFIEAQAQYHKLMTEESPAAQIEGHFWQAQLYLLQGKFRKCEDELSIGIKQAQQTGRKKQESDLLLSKAYIFLRLNRSEEALDSSILAFECAEEADSRDNRKQALHYKALAYIMMERTEEAEQTAEELKSFIELTDTPKHQRYYFHVQALLTDQQGNSSAALNYLNDSVSLLPFQRLTNDKHALFFDAQASILYESGDIFSAKMAYEKILNLTAGRLTLGDIFAKSYYMLGKIQQELGNDSEAKEYYQEFINLWIDADSGIHELEQAKKQMLVLEN